MLVHICSLRAKVTFFFFQAEDGIRDGHVTGVQTCALPISPEVLNCVWRFLTSRRTSPACSMPGQSSTRAGEVFGSRAGDVAFSRPAISRPRSSGGAAAGHAHLGEDLADGVENATHLALSEAADAPDAEAVGDGELAGIDDVATAREAIVEALEVERGIGGHAHGDDDGRLD